MDRFWVDTTGGTVLCFAEADTAVATSMFDLRGECQLDNSGNATDMILVFSPTEEFPYSFRYKTSGALWQSHFTMRRNRIHWQTSVPYIGSLFPGFGLISLDNTVRLNRKEMASVPAVTTSFASTLVLPSFNLVTDPISGTLTTVGERTPEPFPGQFSVDYNVVTWTPTG